MKRFVQNFEKLQQNYQSYAKLQEVAQNYTKLQLAKTYKIAQS